MAITFNTGPMLRYPATGMPLTQAAKSISLWMNVVSATVPATQSLVNATDNSGGDIGYQFGVRSGVVNLWQYGGGTVIADPTGVVAGKWQHYVYTFDGTTHLLYLNGVKIATATNVVMQTGPALDVQIGNNFWGETLNGQLEDIRIYDHALTANEVITLFGTRGCDMIVNGLAGRWRLAEQSTGTVTSSPDESPANRACTVTGAPTYSQSSMHYTRRQS